MWRTRMSSGLENYQFTQKHLLGLADYSKQDILFVLDQAKHSEKY